jgi:hypothetical protein
MSLRSPDPRSDRIRGGGEGRAPGVRRVDKAGDWSEGERELRKMKRRRKG